jgi:hypothetical protein
MPTQTNLETKVSLYNEVNEIIGDKIMADCFIALCVSTLGQFLLSSDHKFFIFQNMFSILETKYTEEQVNRIKESIALIIEKYNIYNDFVG